MLLSHVDDRDTQTTSRSALVNEVCVRRREGARNAASVRRSRKPGTRPRCNFPEGTLSLTSEFTDGRYGWAVACEKAFGPGAHPVPNCHEWNTIAHLNDAESKTEARPLSWAELQQFLDYADDHIDRAVPFQTQGALAAYRDATMLKVI